MKGFTPIILIAISIGIFFFYVDPQYQKIKAHKAEAAEYDKVLDQAEQLKTLRAELETKLAGFSPQDLENLGKLIPEKVDHARLILDVNGVASRYAIEIGDIQTTEASTEITTGAAARKMYKESTFSFTFESSYENMLLFIKDLEQSLRMVDITGISITSGTTPIYSFNITLQAYWLDAAKVEAAATH